MRRIQTASEKELREKRVRVIFGSIVIGLLVLSTVGYALVFGGQIGGVEPTTQVNTTEFERNPDGSYFNGRYFVYTLGTQQHYFSYAKDAVANVSVTLNTTIQEFLSERVYLVGNDSIFLSEVATNLQPYTGSLQRACLGACEEDLPEKDCSDTHLIVHAASETLRVYQEEGCIFIEGDVRATDAFLYRFFGLSTE